MLYGRRPRKTPLLKPRHVKARLAFARANINKDSSFWSSVLWSDETKMELFGHRDVAYVWRKKGEAFKSKNTVPTVKHSANIMLWACFAASGPGNLVKEERIKKKEQYIQILHENVKQSARKLALRRNWVFQQDNVPKHSARVIKK